MSDKAYIADLERQLKDARTVALSVADKGYRHGWNECRVAVVAKLRERATFEQGDTGHITAAQALRLAALDMEQLTPAAPFTTEHDKPQESDPGRGPNGLF